MTASESNLKTIEAECLIMREALECVVRATPTNEMFEFDPINQHYAIIASDALKLHHTARLARRIELLEKIADAARGCPPGELRAAIYELDAHEAGDEK